MIIKNIAKNRTFTNVVLNADYVVAGGGLTGVCSAIAAAREGLRVVLIQDRPVLGGNASSEVRLWALGATSHMGNNNRWSREGGIIDEILVENVYRNKEGNPVLFDMVLMDKVLTEKNITLLLNTTLYKVDKSNDRNISSVTAINSQNGTEYSISGQMFADCTGDGTLGYLAGASFRMGAEDRTVYGEEFAPDKQEYGELLGHSILFYIKDIGKPVEYTAPNFALKDVETLIPKLQNPNYFNVNQLGCKYWWLEYGGRLDTILDTEEIKYELWKVVYGVWDYIKNSGKFPQAKTLTLEWVGLFPGKRESRRFNGLYTLTQQDVINQSTHYDAVAYGGWAIDLHPADGVYAGLLISYRHPSYSIKFVAVATNPFQKHILGFCIEISDFLCDKFRSFLLKGFQSFFEFLSSVNYCDQIVSSVSVCGSDLGPTWSEVIQRNTTWQAGQRDTTLLILQIPLWNNLRKTTCQGKLPYGPSNNICDIGYTIF